MEAKHVCIADADPAKPYNRLAEQDATINDLLLRRRPCLSLSQVSYKPPRTDNHQNKSGRLTGRPFIFIRMHLGISAPIGARRGERLGTRIRSSTVARRCATALRPT
jgi:hypothetical protein